MCLFIIKRVLCLLFRTFLYDRLLIALKSKEDKFGIATLFVSSLLPCGQFFVK